MDTVFELAGRFVLYFVVDILTDVVFYRAGRFVLFILTIGRYRPAAEHEKDAVSAFGAFVLIVSFCTILYLGVD